MAMRMILALILVLCISPIQAATISPSGHFSFHSDKWLNLHHFLYHWAVEVAVEKPRPRSVMLGLENMDVHLGDDQVIWDAAVAAYASVIEKDLLFNREMTTLKTMIASGPEHWPKDDRLLSALNAAMPVYQTHFWTRHEHLNQEFLHRLMPMLKLHESALATQMASDWEGSWPAEPIRVDLVNFANWAGAYTTNQPNHLVIASTDERHLGPGALEVVFHEVGHTRPLGTGLRPVAVSALEKLQADDRFLWHWVIFYAIGEAVRQRYPDYQPYAERQGLWLRGALATHGAFRKFWPAHAQGKTGLAETLEAIVSETMKKTNQPQ